MDSVVASPLEQFQLVPIININPSENLDLSFTNSSLMMGLAVFSFVSMAKALLVDGNGGLVPNRYQTMVEGIYSFIYDMVDSNIGAKGERYFPMIFVLFVFLLVCNLIGMVPYSFTVTSHIIITLALSMTVYIGVT